MCTYIYIYIYIHIHIYTSILSNHNVPLYTDPLYDSPTVGPESSKYSSKDRQHTNFGTYMHGCKRAKRAKRAERPARLDCNSHKTC